MAFALTDGRQPKLRQIGVQMPDQDGVLDEGEIDPENWDPDFDFVDVPQSPETAQTAAANLAMQQQLIESGDLKESE
jgi:hypothetical protein